MHPLPQAESPSSLTETLSEERAATLEQLAAAWQLHVARVEEQLASGWREDLERIVSERFSELAARLQAEFHKELAAQLDATLPTARHQATRDASNLFNQAARRLRQCATQDDWAATLLDSTQGLCACAVLFRLDGQCFRGIGARGLEDQAALQQLPDLQIAVAQVPAFADVLQSRDTVVATRTPERLSEPVAALLGPPANDRACLFPIALQDKVVAVLCTEAGESADLSGLELLAALASAAIATRHPKAAPLEPLIEEHPDWSSLSRQDQELHLRAQRFARVRVAEMRLYKSRAVRTGRARKDLYAELREDIDSGREVFRREFVSASPSMVDYFHLELLRTVANDDPATLGKDYPGPLV